MSARTVNEQEIVNALHQVPIERWPEVLQVLEAFKQRPERSSGLRPILKGTDLIDSDLIGIWTDRTDITDSREFARQLRERASHREIRGKSDAAGH